MFNVELLPNRMPPSHTQFVYYISHLILISGCIGIYLDNIYLGLLELMVFYTSNQYWKDVSNQFNRKLDIVCVQIAFWLHIYHARNSASIYIFYPTFMSGGLMFALAKHFDNEKNRNLSTLCHSMIHFLAFFSNTYLHIYK